MNVRIPCILFITAFSLIGTAYVQGQNGDKPNTLPTREMEQAKSRYVEVAEELKIEIEESERMIDKARMKIKQAREELDRGIQLNSLTEAEISEKRKKINAAERKLKVLEMRLEHTRKYSGEI